MTIGKPFYRNFRAVKPGDPSSGYSSWAYIRDLEYAKDPSHYVRAYLLIQNDLQSIFEFVEPTDECLKAYSYRIHALLMRTCIEAEANFKAILEENAFTPAPGRPLNIKDYRKVDASHHLSSYEVVLPTWNGSPRVLKPFETWRAFRGLPSTALLQLPWYRAYNESKHDRKEKFKQANLENLLLAVSGLLVLLTSQFGGQDFGAGPDLIGASGHDYHQMSAAIGSFFRIKYPDDWNDSELYEFNWQVLMTQPDRFSKFDYDSVPY